MKSRTVRTKRATEGRWSARVTRESDALDLEPGVFKLGSSRAIAASLKRSSEASSRRKADAFRSAMSMLNFYINRAGRNLSGSRLTKLDGAKRELRRLFGKPEAGASARKPGASRTASRARPAAKSSRGRRGAR